MTRLPQAQIDARRAICEACRHFQAKRPGRGCKVFSVQCGAKRNADWLQAIRSPDWGCPQAHWPADDLR